MTTYLTTGHITKTEQGRSRKKEAGGGAGGQGRLPAVVPTRWACEWVTTVDASEGKDVVSNLNYTVHLQNPLQNINLTYEGLAKEDRAANHHMLSPYSVPDTPLFHIRYHI